MTGPGETRLRETLKRVRDMGEVGLEPDDRGPDDLDLDESELWFADSIAED